MYEFAINLGAICVGASVVLLPVAGLVPMTLDLRQELRVGSLESAGAGLLFLFFSWIFGVQEGSFEKTAVWLQRFSYGYVAAFLVLLVGGVVLSKRLTSGEKTLAGRLQRYAILFAIACFLLAALLH